MNSTIFTNMDSVRNYNVFNKNQANASTAMSRATTGLRVANVADSPSDWAVSAKMQERMNSLDQVSRNIQNDTAMAKTAADGVANTLEILNTLKARVLHASDDSASTEDRAVINKEVTTLLAQIDANTTTVKYNGKALLDGTPENIGGSGGESGGDILPDVGVDVNGEFGNPELGEAGYTFQVGEAAGMTIEIKLPKLTSEALGLTGLTDKVFSDAAESKEALKAIEAAIDEVLGAATDIGGVQQRLGYTADNVDTQIENLQASDSAIRDANEAKEITDYLKFNLLSQVSQYMLAQSNQNSFSVLNLLQ